MGKAIHWKPHVKKAGVNKQNTCFLTAEQVYQFSPLKSVFAHFLLHKTPTNETKVQNRTWNMFVQKANCMVL